MGEGGDLLGLSCVCASVSLTQTVCLVVILQHGGTCPPFFVPKHNCQGTFVSHV